MLEANISEYRFGVLAAKNGRLLERLRKGRQDGRPARVWPETEIEIRAFMRNPPKFRPRQKAPAKSEGAAA